MWSPKSAALKTFACRLMSRDPSGAAGVAPEDETIPPVEELPDREGVEMVAVLGGGGAEDGAGEEGSTVAWTEMVYESVVAPTTGAFMEDGLVCFRCS